MPTPRVVRRRRAIKAGMSFLVLSLMSIAAIRVYVLSRSVLSPEQAAGLNEQESAIVGLINAERIRAGLPPLRLSARVTVVARGHSYDMALRHYLAHSSPEGSGPADRLRGEGISFLAAGENIYADNYRDFERLAVRARRAWLEDAEHRATMLSPQYTETGVGAAHSADGKTYVTQDFIR